MSKFIGIDVSKATFDVSFRVADRWQHCSFPNEKQGFKEFLEIVAPTDHCVMEATGPYYLPLASFINDQNIKVSVVNPLIIRRFAQMRLSRAKTDKKDAQIIAQYAEFEQTSLWQQSSKVKIYLQQLMSCSELLEKQQTMLTNQLEAFKASGVRELQAINSIKACLKTIKEQLIEIEAKTQEFINNHFNQSYQSVLSIPGIGKKTAIALVVLTDGFTRFDNYKQLIAYIGFSPRIHQSGTSVKGKGHICKMGNSRVRKLLYLCSWSAKRYNKPCIEMYERLKEKGKPERVIKIAIANKLIKQAFAIAKSCSVFDKDYSINSCF